MIRSANPYLNFPGTTEEAFHFYASVLGGEPTGLVRFRDFGDNTMGLSEEELDLVAHVALPLGSGQMLMGTDVGCGPDGDGDAEGWRRKLVVGTNAWTLLEVESAADADRIFAGLSDGGTVEMPLMPVAWAEKYGTCRDRYGVQWMVSYTGSVEFPG